MQQRIDVSTAGQAWVRAATYLQTVYTNAKFAAHLSSLRLVNCDDNGLFTLEAPTQEIVDIFNRRSEWLTVQQAIEICVPPGVQVRVEIVLAWAVQHG